MERYIVVSVQTAEHEQESLIYFLAEVGAEGFEQDADRLKAYFREDGFSEASVSEVVRAYPYKIEVLEPQNWNQEWESRFPMVVLEGICEIYASHHQPTYTQPYSLYIQPQMSFGTGHHATTQLMLRLLSSWNCEGYEILDMGAGTGILGIFCLLKKAKKVTFIDIEPVAVENIRSNVKHNGLPEQEVLLGDHTCIQGTWDAILANIHKNVLLQHAPVYYEHLKPQGDLFLSGFFDFDEAGMQKVYRELGFKCLQRLEDKGWIALHLQKI